MIAKTVKVVGISGVKGKRTDLLLLLNLQGAGRYIYYGDKGYRKP